MPHTGPEQLSSERADISGGLWRDVPPNGVVAGTRALADAIQIRRPKQPKFSPIAKKRRKP